MGWALACALADLPSDEALGVIVDGQEVALARAGQEVLAVEDLCSHAAVTLSEGDLEAVDGDADGAACTLECWLHGSRFDLRTGAPIGLPATEPVATFPVDLRDGNVYVDTTRTLNGVTPG